MVVTESLQPILQRQKNPTVFNVSLLTLINNKRAFTKGSEKLAMKLSERVTGFKTATIRSVSSHINYGLRVLHTTGDLELDKYSQAGGFTTVSWACEPSFKC